MRPIGVVLIAIRYFLNALGIMLIAISLKLELGTGLVNKLFGSSRLLAEERDVAMAVLIILALPSLIVGYGLWKLRPWARKLCLFTSGLFLVDISRKLISEAGNVEWPSETYDFSSAVIYLLIVWYLLQPDVKARFQRPVAATPSWHNSRLMSR
jgi:uncharacterized membrane protein (DUF2068 family)